MQIHAKKKHAEGYLFCKFTNALDWANQEVLLPKLLIVISVRGIELDSHPVQQIIIQKLKHPVQQIIIQKLKCNTVIKLRTPL
jgi:hypothetical protein